MDTSYYTLPAYSTFASDDFSTVKFHMGDLEEYDDRRFLHAKSFQGIGNGTLMRINACFSLRLNLWCLKPQRNAFVAWGAHMALPLAASADFVLNIALLVTKVVIGTLICAGKCGQRLYDKDAQLLNNIAYVGRNLFYQARVISQSSKYILYEAFASVTANLLGPKYDLYFRSENNFHWAYKLHRGKYQLENVDKHNTITVTSTEVILDKGRVNYLRQLGWQIKDEDLKQLCPPWWSSSAKLYRATTPSGKVYYKSEYVVNA